MPKYNHSREVQDYNSYPSTSALDGQMADEYWLKNGVFLENSEQKSYFQPQDQGYCQSGDVNPEDSPAAQITPPLTDGSPVEDRWEDLELKTPSETAVISPCDYFSGGPLEVVAHPGPLPSTQCVKECSPEDDTSAEDLDAWLSRSFGLRSDANSNDQALAPENNQLTLSTNITNPLPNSQGRANFAESTGGPAPVTFLANDCPGPSSYSAVGQANAASNWTGGPATMTGLFGAPPNYGQRPSHPRFMGQVVVASGPPVHPDQPTRMHGMNATVAHFPMAGWHQSMYGRQPRNAPAHCWNAQMGGGHSLYDPVAHATVAPNIQAYAGPSMSMYGTNPPLTQAPIMGALPVYERQPRRSHAITNARAARREKRHAPYKLSSASQRTKISSESEIYCQWGDCSAGPMTLIEVRAHFRAHGEKVMEGDRIKECLWKGCDSKPGAFPMKCDGFRRHVNETESHAEIGDLSKVTCEKCGLERAKRSMGNHRRICSGESKDPEDNGKSRD